MFGNLPCNAERPSGLASSGGAGTYTASHVTVALDSLDLGSILWPLVPCSLVTSGIQSSETMELKLDTSLASMGQVDTSVKARLPPSSWQAFPCNAYKFQGYVPEVALFASAPRAHESLGEI